MIERLPKHEVNQIEIVTWEGLRRPNGSPFVIAHKNFRGMIFWNRKERDEFRRMFPGVIAEQTSWGSSANYADYANRLGPERPIAVISLSQYRLGRNGEPIYYIPPPNAMKGEEEITEFVSRLVARDPSWLIREE